MMVLLPIQSLAQDDGRSYTVGERVEYRDTPYSQVWWPGTIVKLYPPEYKQVLVHWDPRANSPTFTRNGVSLYEAGYNMDMVRHMKARTADKPEVKTDQAKQAYIQGGVGLMTKDEILGYMRTHGFVNGVAKYDAQVCKDLIEQIKRRGVKEKFAIGKNDLSPIYSNGCGTPDTDVTGAVEYNVGPPTTVAWLSATWLMYVIGGTVDTAPGDGYIYRTNESIGKLGFLAIGGNGTYTWKIYLTTRPRNM